MEGEPQGTMVDGAYFIEGSNKSRAIIFLTDIFGLPLVNCKIMADRFAKELDCDVWVPDLFAGTQLPVVFPMPSAKLTVAL